MIESVYTAALSGLPRQHGVQRGVPAGGGPPPRHQDPRSHRHRHHRQHQVDSAQRAASAVELSTNLLEDPQCPEKTPFLYYILLFKSVSTIKNLQTLC